MELPAPTLPRRTNTLAVVSLVSGILAWVLLPFVGAIVALVTGVLARREIRVAEPPEEGDGLAVAGIVLGGLQLVVSLLMLVVVFVFLGGLAWFGWIAR